MIQYKFDEPDSLDEIRKYIDQTYGEHYAQTKIQTTEFIIDQGHGIGWCVGNILKYAQRYGKKEGHNRKDILKAIHYAIQLLHVHNLNLQEPTKIFPEDVVIPTWGNVVTSNCVNRAF